MNRSERRAFEKKLQALLRTDGDHCTGCRRSLIHNEPLAYGALRDGRPAVVGNCCEHRLSFGFAKGVYVTRHTGTISTATPKSPSDAQPQNPDELVARFREGVSQLDRYADDVMRQAGVPKGQGSINTSDSDWKAEDAAWFSSNPTRSHRMRPTNSDEIEQSPLKGETLPPGHRFETVIRQVQPGMRIRKIYARNIALDVPDIEPLLHALFDRVSAGAPGVPISHGEVAELALKYAGSFDKGASS